jgi:hypothetical protein
MREEGNERGRDGKHTQMDLIGIFWLDWVDLGGCVTTCDGQTMPELLIGDGM